MRFLKWFVIYAVVIFVTVVASAIVGDLLDLHIDDLNLSFFNSGNVEITLSAGMLEYASIEEVMADATSKGITITQNDDGSYSYAIPKSQHVQMMKNMGEAIDEYIADILSDESFKAIENITHNAKYTQFDITAVQTEFESSMFNSFVILGLGLQGLIYQRFNGTPDNNVTIQVVDPDTSAIYQTVVYPDDAGSTTDLEDDQEPPDEDIPPLLPSAPTSAVYGENTYKVGVDIPAGEYWLAADANALLGGGLRSNQGFNRRF